MINDFGGPVLAIGVMDVLGIVALVVMTLLLLVGLWIGYHIWKFKRAINDLGKTFKSVGETFKKGIVPVSLGLESAEDGAMSHEVALTSARAELEAAGLRFGGAYRSSKMPSMLLATFADPDRGVTAAVANAGSFGITCDVVTMYEDGSAMTHRTLKSLGLDKPPQFHSVEVPDGKPAEVLARHLAERDTTKPFRRFEPDEVVEAMEEFNNVLVRWRTERGGLTEDEVRRNLKATGKEADDTAVKFAVAASKAEAERRRIDEERPADS